ncbi:MAG: NAD(+)/NADH kinase [Spirochaetales bacterium]|nr:NAD(+)/NADH kinase [Spirochaetales bacterium]
MKVKKAVIAANMNKSEVPHLIEQISEYLSQKGILYSVVELREKSKKEYIDDCDLVFSLGGDGTVLYVSRILKREIPVFAVNLGRVGFITEILQSEWKEAFELFLQDRLDISRRLMISVIVKRGGEEVFACEGLNDIVISSAGISKLINFDVNVGDSKMGSFRADGIIFASPTGSTGYSAAAGGPILVPELECFIINTICPYSLSNRPVVVDSNACVSVDLPDSKNHGLILTVDGQETFSLELGDRVFYKKSSKKLSLVMSNQRLFFDVMRDKLNWSGGSNA